MVTQGLAVSVISSGVRSGSTSTGLVVAIRPWWQSRGRTPPPPPRAAPAPARPPYAGPVPESTALLTDHYELTMLQAALGAGTAHRRSVFELYPRRLPEGRRYGVVAGVGRALDAIDDFRFDEETLGALDGVVDEPTCEWLSTYRFSGDVWGYAEGETYFPYSPLL